MRQARLKPDYQDTWHHCYNRTVGTRADRPFGDAEKEVFVRMLKRLAAFYSVRLVSYTFMSNHFHIILQAPLAAPSEEEAAAHYAAFHRGKREIRPGTAICREWTGRLRDVSWFMRHFQHLGTAWHSQHTQGPFCARCRRRRRPEGQSGRRKPMRVSAHRPSPGPALGRRTLHRIRTLCPGSCPPRPPIEYEAQSPARQGSADARRPRCHLLLASSASGNRMIGISGRNFSP